MRKLLFNFYGHLGEKQNIDCSVVNSLIYPPDRPIKIGVVITTYASTSYVHLGLACLSKNCPNLPVLVHDDCSSVAPNLAKITNALGYDFESNNIRLGHTLGDLSGFLGGLLWAQKNNIDLLVKLSRRFIPIYNWTTELEKLARSTQFTTFSNVCMNLNWGFRSECVAMHVPSWSKIALEDIRNEVLTAKDVFVEGFIHGLSRKVANTCVNKEFLDKNKKADWCSGHVDWPIMGRNRIKKVPGLLWHYSCEPQEYYELSKTMRLPYTINDFISIGKAGLTDTFV